MMNLGKVDWEKVDCDICGCENYSIYRDNIAIWEYKGNFRIVKCVKCGLCYLNPRPKKEFIKKYYPPKTNWGINLLETDSNINDLYSERSSNFKRIYDTILSYKRSGAIFDVGAGYGLFLTYFKEIGWKVDGVELSKEAVNFANKVLKIREIKNGNFEVIKTLHNKFDVVSFNSVLEHLYSPLFALKKANIMLKKNGLLVITVPNIESLGSFIFKKHWLGLQPPKHLYHFSPQTLAVLLNKSKFESIKIDHWHWKHCYYSLFESFRFLFSPRFNIRKSGIIEKAAVYTEDKHSYKNVIIELGKVFAALFAITFTILGSAIGRGEVVTVYAKKI